MTEHNLFHYSYPCFTHARHALLNAATLWFRGLVALDSVCELGCHRRGSPCPGGRLRVAGRRHLADSEVGGCLTKCATSVTYAALCGMQDPGPLHPRDAQDGDRRWLLLVTVPRDIEWAQRPPHVSRDRA